MHVSTFPLGPWGTNAYVLSINGQAIVIDPGQNPKPVIELIENEGLKLTHILITHMHSDHIYGIASLQQHFNITALTPPNDNYLKGTPDAEGGDGWPYTDPFKSENISLGDKSFDNFLFQTIETPGHTKGSISYYFPNEKAIFVGDVLFLNSIGSTEFLGGDRDQLFNSIKNKLYSLPDDTKVYPGHGPATTIGHEKKTNPFVRA